MSRMTRADFIKLCAGAYVVAHAWPRLGYAYTTSAPQINAQRAIQHLAEVPTDRAPVVTGVSLSPDTKILATAGDDHIVRLWSVVDGQLLQTLRQHRDWVRSTEFSPDGKFLATAGDDRTVNLWNVTTGKLVKTVAKQKLGIRCVRFNPTGSALATAGFEEVVRVYDLATTNQTKSFPAPCPDMRAVAFSADGKTLAAGGRDGRLRLWELNSGTHDSMITAHKQRMRALAFSPDGLSLASAGDDQQIQIWDITTTTPKMTLQVRGSKIMALSWCGNQTIAAGGSDNLIHLLALQTQQELAVLTGHTGTITALVADQTGRLLASGSFDTTARLWNLEQVVAGASTARLELPKQNDVTPAVAPGEKQVPVQSGAEVIPPPDVTQLRQSRDSREPKNDSIPKFK